MLKHKITEGQYLYLLSLSRNKELVGAVVLLSKEDIVFFDIETMKSNKRTISYINLDKKITKEIITLLVGGLYA